MNKYNKQKIWLKGLKIWLKIKRLKLNKEKNWSNKLALLICLSAYYCLFNCQGHRLLHKEPKWTWTKKKIQTLIIKLTINMKNNT